MRVVICVIISIFYIGNIISQPPSLFIQTLKVLLKKSKLSKFESLLKDEKIPTELGFKIFNEIIHSWSAVLTNPESTGYINILLTHPKYRNYTHQIIDRKNILNHHDKCYYYYLMQTALRQKNNILIEDLLQRGFSPHSFILFARKNKDIKKLFNFLNYRHTEIDINQTDYKGNTVLHYLMKFDTNDNTFIENKFKDITYVTEDKIRFLLSYGASPNIRNKSSVTPLYYMLYSKNPEIHNVKVLDLLIQHGADYKYVTLTPYKIMQKLLIQAIADKNIRVTKFILDTGLTIFFKTKNKKSPLKVSLHNPCKEIQQLFQPKIDEKIRAERLAKRTFAQKVACSII